MNQVRFEDLSIDPTPYEMPASRPIRPARQSQQRAAAAPLPTDQDGALAGFTNVYRNSRLPAALPVSTAWSPFARRSIGEDFLPDGLLATDEKVVLSTALGLLVYDNEGEPVGGLINSLSVPVMAPALSHVLFIDRNSYLAGHPLADDAVDFKLSPTFGNTYRRDLITFAGKNLILIGQKVIPVLENPDADPVKAEACIDVWEWNSDPTADEDGYATNLSGLRSLGINSDNVVAAVTGESLALAVTDNLCLLDGNINMLACLTGRFTPVAMSGDEDGYVYIISAGERANRLMVVDSEGQLVTSSGIPGPGPKGYMPPIVGYDHTVYIPVEDRILVFDALGRHGTDLPVSPQFAGAVVTVDGTLMVSDGERVLAFPGNADSDPLVIAEFKGEQLRTAPVLLKSGVIWVATNKHLYGLKPVQ